METLGGSHLFAVDVYVHVAAHDDEEFQYFVHIEHELLPGTDH